MFRLTFAAATALTLVAASAEAKTVITCLTNAGRPLRVQWLKATPLRTSGGKTQMTASRHRQILTLPLLATAANDLCGWLLHSKTFLS